MEDFSIDKSTARVEVDKLEEFCSFWFKQFEYTENLFYLKS